MIHLVAKPLEAIYPVWGDENLVYGEGEGEKKKLDNMLHDIIHGCVDKSVWVKGNGEKRKNVAEECDDGFVDSQRVKKKKERSQMSGQKVIVEREYDGGEDPERGVTDGVGSIGGLSKLVKGLVSSVEVMDNNIYDKLSVFTDKLDGLDKKVELLQDEVAGLKKIVNDKGNDQDSCMGEGDSKNEVL